MIDITVPEMVVGQCYYVMTHAYHHYLGRLAKIHGPGRYAFVEVSKVHSHPRDWTDFFAHGAMGTRYDSVPDKPYLVCFDVTEWSHELPPRKDGAK